MMMLVLLFSAALCVTRSDGQLQFANVYQDHMMFQRNESLYFWGPYHGNQVASQVVIKSDGVRNAEVSFSDGIWFAAFEQGFSVLQSGITATVLVQRSDTGAVWDQVSDVIFGDVVLISGQSNVGISVKYSNQFSPAAEQENLKIADQIGPMVRIVTVPQSQGSPTPQIQFSNESTPCKLPSDQCGNLAWARANNTNVVGFSALGWYIARELYALGAEKVPIGIVQSDIPGTPIQHWTSASAIRDCVPASANGTEQKTSVLFNSMLNPLFNARFKYKSMIWYQGESNVGNETTWDGDKYYGCALPAMIKDWRTQMKASTPMFVVELAAYCNEHDESTFMVFCDSNTSILTERDVHLPALRIAQAQALTVEKTYISSAMDLGSLHPLPYASIHPTDKQTLGHRIVLAMRQENGDTEVVAKGPRPVSARQQRSNSQHSDVGASDGVTVSIEFTLVPGAGSLALNVSAVCTPQVLDVYCPRAQLNGFEVFSAKTEMWSAPDRVAVAPDLKTLLINVNAGPITRVRYAYADWPVVSLTNSNGGLPARVFDIPVSVLVE